MTNKDENVTYQAETMQKRPKLFVGTCYRCGEVGHRARDCRKSVDLPGNSANKTRKTEMIADVDRTAVLGGEPAETVCGVDEGHEERKPQLRIQQTNFYCEENRQRSGNANGNIPGTHGLPLVGEWIVCASGEASDSKLGGIESEGCASGMDERACVDEADGSEGLGDRADGSGRQSGDSSSQTGPRGQADVLSTLNRAEMAGISRGEGAGVYLGAADAERVIDVTDGFGRQTDVSSGHWDLHSVETNANKPAEELQIISIPREKAKPPDSPMKTVKRTLDKPNGLGNQTDRSSVRTDAHSVGNETQKPANETESVSTRQTDAQTRNLPYTPEIAKPELVRRWRKVSVKDVDVYVPWSAPVEALGRTFAFRRLESEEEVVAPGAEGERAYEGEGDRDGDDMDGDGTASSGNADSTRVNGVRLAGEAGQHEKTNAETKKNVPVSSGPPIQREERPYGDVTRRRRHGKIKSEPANISPTRNGGKAYLGHASAAQPPINAPKRRDGVHRTCRQHGRIKFIPTKVSQSRKDETAYLGRTGIAQPRGNDPKRAYRVIGLRRQRGRIKIEPVKVKTERLNDKKQQKVETTYLGQAHTAQPPANASKHRREVYRPKRRRGRIKIESTNVSRTENGGSTYLQCGNAIRSTWRPKKDVRRSDKLTVECWMPGEPWREDGRLEIEHISVHQAGEDEITYRGCAQLAQPPPNDSKRPYMVIGPRRRRGRTKSRPRNANQTEEVESTYLTRVNAIRSDAGGALARR